MNPKEYLENVLKTESINFDSIKSRMQSEFVIRLDHVSDGLCTEAGEFKDQLKKFKFYGRDLDIINLVEEIGDTLWYVGIACNVLGISMEEVMEKNIAKLKSRYEGKFSETKAENRDLEKERKLLSAAFIGLEVGEECLDKNCEFFTKWKHSVSDHPRLINLKNNVIHYSEFGTKTICGQLMDDLNELSYSNAVADVTCKPCKDELVRIHFDRMQ